MKALILPAGVQLNDVQLCKTECVSGLHTISSHKTAELWVDAEKRGGDAVSDLTDLRAAGQTGGGWGAWFT